MEEWMDSDDESDSGDDDEKDEDKEEKSQQKKKGKKGKPLFVFQLFYFLNATIVFIILVYQFNSVQLIQSSFLLCWPIACNILEAEANKKKKKRDSDDEAFEESDDGDEEGREVDYISDSSLRYDYN